MSEAEIKQLKTFWDTPTRATAYFEVVQQIVEDLNATDDRVLDVGCHKGYTTCSYAACGPSHVFGVEIDETAMDKRKKYLEEIPTLNEKTSFIQGSSDQLPLEDGTLQGVVMNEALSHYGNPTASLREAYRVLKSGGRLYIFDDNNKLSIEGWYRRRFKRWPPYREEYDNKRRQFLSDQFGDFSAEKIESLVKQTRGMTYREMKQLINEDGSVDHPRPETSAPRDPNTGAYAEREINPFTLVTELESIGFEPELVPTDFSVVSPFQRAMSTLFKWTHPVSLLLTPGFTVIAKKP